MAKLADMLGNSKRMDLYRISKNENVPTRGLKKHYTQMNDKEKNFIFATLKSYKNWGMSGHALDRLVEKGIEATYEDIVSTIHNSMIIEYHVAKFQGVNDERVLLRSKAIVNKCNNLHVVFSITRGRIVSVWMNHKDDKHSTIDMSDYSKSVKIIGMN